MKIIVIGGAGTIGKEVVALLKPNHEVITVGRNSGDYHMNMEDKSSIEKMFQQFKNVNGVISLAGDAELSPFHLQSDEQIDLAINSKLKANINLVRVAVNHINPEGFIILTSGTASHEFIPGASSVSMALSGLEGYVKAIQLEPHNNIRVNVVRPVVVTETLRTFKLDLPYSVSAEDTAKVYQHVVESDDTEVITNVSDLINL